MRHLFSSILIFCAAAFFASSAQAEWNDSIRYDAEIGMAFGGGDHTPFWMVSNRYGMSSVKKNNGYIRAGVFKELDNTKRFSWGAGVDLAVAARFTSHFIVQQLYGEVKYRCLGAVFGSKEMCGFESNPDLGSGNLLYAANSRPIPQLRVGIPDYADVWGCKGFFAIKGYIAYGKFTDNRWIESWVNKDYNYTLSTLYHSKGLFLRFGNDKKFPLTGEIGIEMATQFGGRAWFEGKWHKLPTGFSNWLKALIPRANTEKDAISGEDTNIEGNVLGTWDFALSWHPADADWNIRLYYEHFFEDHSQLFFNNYAWKDGLWGVRVDLPCRWVSSALAEVLYMKDQSNPILWNQTPEIPTQVSGNDDYYNHYIYNGWQNWGMGIGNPLIIAPVYNADHIMTFKSTRMWGVHIGLKGEPTDEISYRVLGSCQKSWGTYYVPFKYPKRSLNLYLEAGYAPKKLKGWKAVLGLGLDRGELIGNNYGVSLKISKTGWFLGKKSHKL